MGKITLLVLLILLGCAGQPIDTPDPLIYYKRNLKAEVNGFKGYGTLVVPKSAKYKLELDFPGRGDLVVLKTCHREEEREKLGRKETIRFQPNPGIEDLGVCYLQVDVLEHKRGRHAWLILDFEHPSFTLPAYVSCNGQNYNSNGVTICQSKQGLTQIIEFSEPVQLNPKLQNGEMKLNNHKCPIPTGKIKKWEFSMPNRECTYIWFGSSGKKHKLLTVGYEDILLREI